MQELKKFTYSVDAVNEEMVGFANNIGLHISQLRPGYCEGEVDLSPDSMNHLNIPHGGLIYTLADTVSGFASGCLEPPYAVTSASNMFFLKAAKGTRLIARAESVKHGRTISVVDVNIYDELDTHVAHGSFQFTALPDKK